MTNKNSLVKGALVLTCISFISRFMGFFYRIFLSRIFGEEGVGIYQLIFPVFALCLAFSVSGMQTALSRTVACKISAHNSKEAKISLLISFLFSLLLSLIAMVIVQQNASFIAIKLIHDKRCTILLIIMTYAIPFATIHSCISGYYFGLKKTRIPAISQLLEQFFRISFVYLICLFALKKNLEVQISYAVSGLVIGEITSAICSLISLKTSEHMHLLHAVPVRYNLKCFLKNAKELTSLSVPLSANRIILTVLQSIEAISIPYCLQEYGYSVSQSLSIYGVLAGMALPCILFPSAITNSIAVLLTPTVAGIQTSSYANKDELKKIVSKTCILCFILGMSCCLFFLLFGNVIGNLLFHSQMAGRFLLILAWICPFLYMNTTLASILNGLGKTFTTFFINFMGISIRILSIFLLIPFFDLKGYLWGLLISQFIVCLLSIFYLKRYLSNEE